MELCVCHFKGDLEWLKSCEYPITIVQKDGGDSHTFPVTFTIPNKSMDAPAYLAFIINRYHNLPDYTAFIHGHESSYHQLGDRPLLDMIRTANVSKYDFIPINNFWRTMLPHLALSRETINVGKPLNFEFPEHMVFEMSSQFVVSKKAILRYPKDFYQFCYNLIMSSDARMDQTSGFFEVIWHIIFTGKAAVFPKEDYFCPPMKEIFFFYGGVPVKPGILRIGIISKDSPPDDPRFVHLRTTEEYEYHKIRGTIAVRCLPDDSSVLTGPDVSITLPSMDMCEYMYQNYKHMYDIYNSLEN